VIIAVWAVFVTLLEFFGVFSEGLFALLAGKGLGVVRGGVGRGCHGQEGNVPFQSFEEVDGFLVRHGIRRSQTIFDLSFVRMLTLGGRYRDTYSRVI
jgi:hypothetical protein